MNLSTFTLITFLLLPQLVSAQIITLNSFKTGSYVLNTNRRQRIEGKLKLADNKLVTKDAQGKKISYKPEEIYSCRIEDRPYTVWRGFSVGAGLLRDYRGASFVEILDSGQVMLTRYHYQVRNNYNNNYGSSFEQDIYLVRGSKSYSSPTDITDNFSDKQKAALQSTLAFYLTNRPDLAKYLADGRIFTGNLKAFIHALNTGQPFN